MDACTGGLAPKIFSHLPPSLWIPLAAIVLAPLVLLSVRSVMMIADFFGLRERHDQQSPPPIPDAIVSYPPTPDPPPQAKPAGAADVRTCGVCGGTALAVARVCRHCGASLH